METPKAPARSQLRRPSTSPYARRKRDASEPAEGGVPASAAEGEATPGASPTAPARATRKRTAPSRAAATATATALELAVPVLAPGAELAIAILPSDSISDSVSASIWAPLDVDDVTALPAPRHLPSGAPTDAAPAPGRVPRGDSRSLRRGDLFALVYRVHCFVVTRHGHVGQLGYWSAVEYPTPSAASHAYARGCSHWVSEGFLDYRG